MRKIVTARCTEGLRVTKTDDKLDNSDSELTQGSDSDLKAQTQTMYKTGNWELLLFSIGMCVCVHDCPDQ